MKISRTETDSVSEVLVSEAAGLGEAAALRTILIECLDSRRTTVLDVSNLERPDAAALQLIHSAVRSFEAAGVPLKLRDGGSDAVFGRTLAAAGFASLEAEETI